MAKKKKKVDLNNIKPEEKMKYEIAKELGLIDRVVENGWGSLSAQETGRIGGIITKRRRQAKKEAVNSNEKEDVTNI
ncbi:MAG: small, acid-soluble spore protein, alpha/beta type [Clostridiales bacterium]|nr:small, acid-soluble spore protein, alpha/beta type [Clostridiales bacterium]